MELINNRYQLIRSLENSENFSLYVAKDLLERNRKKMATVIDGETMSVVLPELCSDEQMIYKNPASPFILKNYGIEPIKKIGSKRNEQLQYCILSEFIENSDSLYNMLDKIPRTEILNLFSQACRGVCYLHKKNTVYRYINFTNIFIIKDNTYSLKIRDSITAWLQQETSVNLEINGEYFNAPEASFEHAANTAGDIYSLGVLLFCLSSAKKDVSRNFKADLNLYKETNNDEFAKKIIPIIEKATADINSRYPNIPEFLESVNEAFKTNFKAFYVSELEHFNSDISLVGRNKELAAITEICDKIIAGTATQRCVYVHGVYGIGKTTLLTVLKNNLYLQNANVFWAFGSEKYGALTSILKQMADTFDYNENESDFISFIISITNGLFDGKPEYYMNAVVKFIYDCVRDKPVVLIIDDMDKADDFTISAFEKLLAVCKRLCIVFSCGNTFDNSRLSAFISRIKKDGEALDIDLPPLSEEDTRKVIQHILSLSHTPIKLTEATNKNACGNPLFIEEILKNLHMNRILYSREEDGDWNVEHGLEGYDKIPMPTSIEQAVRQQAEKISGESREILEAMSIFEEILVTEAEIMPFMEKKAESLTKLLDTLIARGILYADYINNEISYGFSNKILKKYMYEKRSRKEIIKAHTLAADLLIKNRKQSGENLDEIIYHLEESGQNEQAFNFFMIAGKKYEDLFEYEESAKYYKKAAILSQRHDFEDSERYALIKLADMLTSALKYKSAMDYLPDLKVKAHKANDIKTLAHTYVLLANCYKVEMDYTKYEEYMELARVVFSDTYNRTLYIDIYLEYLIMMLEKLSMTAYASEFYDAVNYSLSVCPKEHPKYNYYTAYFTDRLGNYYKFNGEYDKAISIYEEALEFAEKTDDFRRREETLANLSTCYFYKSDHKMSEIINEVLLVKSRSPFTLSSVSYNLFSARFMSSMDADKAGENYNEILRLAGIAENHSLKFLVNTDLVSVFCEKDKYSEAYEHFLFCKKTIQEETAYRCYAVPYYNVAVNLYYKMGVFDKALEYIEKAEKSISINKNYASWLPLISKRKENISFMELLKSHQSLSDFESIIIDSYKAELKKTLNTSLTVANYCALSDFIISLKRHNCLLYIKGMFEETLEKAEQELDFPPFVEPLRIYMKSLRCCGDKKLSLLMDAFHKAIERKRTLLSVYICEDLGEYYAKTNVYYYLDYTARACEAVQCLLLSVPEDFRVSYAKKYCLFSPTEKILSAKQASKNKSSLSIKDIFDENLFSELITDKNFKAEANEMYFSNLPYNIVNNYDVIKYLCKEAEDNLTLLACYFSAVAHATKCFIAIDTPENGFLAVTSNDSSLNMPEGNYILKRAKAIGTDIIATEKGNNISDDTGNLLGKGEKAAMCIPLVTERGINGYVYLYSESIFHNINSSSAEEIKWFMNVVSMNISLHIIKINSMLDKLSGALNRKYLDIALDYHIEKAAKTGTTLSVIMSDLDSFKGINDTYGHQTGDFVIKTTGNIIRANLRKDTPFGRYGGEEFVIILENTDTEDALKVAEKLRCAIENAKILGSKRPVTVSMGISTYGVHDVTKAGLIEKADKALYICKEKGRNCSRAYDSSYEVSAKSTNTAKGIISGDSIKNALNIRMTLDILEIISTDMPLDKKIPEFLGKLRELTESETIFFIQLKNEEVIQIYGKGEESVYCRDSVILSSKSRKCIFKTEVRGKIKRSVMIIPLENTTVLYLSALLDKREYKPEDTSLAHYWANLAAMIAKS